MTREEAINEIKSWDFLNEKESEAVRTLIPELRESEDERIRKALLSIVLIDKAAGYTEGYKAKGITCEDAIAYLEKQKEQKPAEWSEEDERMRNQLIYDVEQHKEKCLISAKQNKATKAIYDGIEKCQDEKIAWLKSLHSSWKPSEEQMKGLKFFLDLHRQQRNAGTTSWREYDALESLCVDLNKFLYESTSDNLPHTASR